VRKTSGRANDEVRREARIAGLREFTTPSLEAVERRRAQLWVRTAILLAASVAATAFVSTWPAGRVVTLDAGEIRTGLAVLAAAFVVFVAVEELHLGRLTRLLTNERVLTAALTNRLHEVELLLDAGRELSAVLELPVLLETILRSATELLGAGGGSVLLAHGDELVAATVRGREEARGARIRFGDGVAGHVALRREPILIHGHVDPHEFPGLADRAPYVESAMSVPIVHRDELLGVLNVNAALGRAFTQHDLRALAVFAEQAAAALANANLYEAERAQVAQLRRLRPGREAG
jgi:putative methionine-R-sulfoxide reductase with GAF domain